MFVDPSGADWYKNKDGNVEHRKQHGKAGDEGWLGNGKTLDYEGYSYSKNGASKILETVVVTAMAKAKERTQPVWAGFHWNSNYSHEEVLQSQYNYGNFQKGNFNGLSQDQLKLYRQWKQADKEWKTLSYTFVGGIAAPLAAVGAIESGASYYAYQGGSWLIRKYGVSFAKEVAKEAIANRGAIRKMDWSDIIVSTALSRWKFVGANGVTEMINATSDLSIDGSYQNSFLIGNKYEKKILNTATDLFFSSLKLKYPGVYQDAAVDQMQTQFNKIVGF